MLNRLLTLIAILLIRIYQWVFSPLKTYFFGPQSCRFHPSCSEYGRQSCAQHGLLKGLSLTFLRVLRCHPFHPGGVDLVPKKQSPFINK